MKHKKGITLFEIVLLILVMGALCALSLRVVHLGENKDEPVEIVETKVEVGGYYSGNVTHFITTEGLECTALLGHKKGGLSCNWAKYNKEN